MHISKFILYIFILITTLSACQKENYTNWSIAENMLNAEEVAMDIFSQMQYLQDKYFTYFTENCATIEQHNLESFTLDFGSSCFGEDARTRAGKWHIINDTYTDTDISRGNHFTYLTFDNYIVNNFLVKGSITFEFNNENSFKIFYLKAENLEISKTLGDKILWSGNQTFVQIEGNTTHFNTDGERAFHDDIYKIEGYSFYIDENNNKYENTILTPLEKKINCRWITKGSMSLDIGEKEKQLINFGDGSCDNTTLVSINRWSTAIHTFQ